MGMMIITNDPSLSTLIDQIHAAIPTNAKAYLVGGAVRDLISGRNVHDLDFLIVTSERVIPIARKIAGHLNADFYPMDKERDTSRVIVHSESGELDLDFASLRDETLHKNLG